VVMGVLLRGASPSLMDRERLEVRREVNKY